MNNSISQHGHFFTMRTLDIFVSHCNLFHSTRQNPAGRPFQGTSRRIFLQHYFPAYPKQLRLLKINVRRVIIMLREWQVYSFRL